MQTRAKAKYLRISPRRIRLVLNSIKGKQVDAAFAHLKFMNKNDFNWRKDEHDDLAGEI